MPKHDSEIQEERNSSFTVAQKQKIEALQAGKDTLCPNTAEANIDAEDHFQEKFVQYYESNEVMSQREACSDNKSSVMMQQNNS